MRDLAFDLVEHTAATTYDMLPHNVAEITKKFILDTLATSLVGSSAPGCSTVIEQAKDWGGKQESTILVYGGKLISTNAAFANSVMAHAVDFDDTHDEAIIHANVWVLPAALAIAERMGSVSGKDLITAVTIGVDATCRLSLGALGLHGGNAGAYMGYFGATLAAGKILGFDENKLHHAIGIAYSLCAGNRQCIVDRALVKRMQPAFGARGAILSALLAQGGITGARDIFEGQYGLFPVYLMGEYDREKIVGELGERFEGENLSIKLYPCCRFTHPAIDAALSIAQKNAIAPDDIKEVIVHVTQSAYDMVGKRFEIRESPQVDAQFSIPYTVSLAITRRNVFVDDFFEQNIRKDKPVLQLAKRVRVIADQKPIGKGLVPCVVEIITKDENLYSQRIEVVRGNPMNPVSITEVAEKFRTCAAFSAKPISKENLEQTIELVDKLENVQDISSITMLLSS